MILFAKAAKLGRREKVPPLPSTGIREVTNFKNNELLEIPIWQRLEDRVVDDAEDDSGSANAKSQGKDGDGGEAAVFAQVARGITKVARQTIQISFHRSKLYAEATANCRNFTMAVSSSYLTAEVRTIAAK